MKKNKFSDLVLNNNNKIEKKAMKHISGATSSLRVSYFIIIGVDNQTNSHDVGNQAI